MLKELLNLFTLVRLNNKALTGLLCAAILLFFAGCYTSFSHPDVGSGKSFVSGSDIYVSDDCMECHSASEFEPKNVLPKQAETNANWQFYSNSAWWLDGSDFYPVNNVPGSNNEMTMPRSTAGYNGGAIQDGLFTAPIAAPPATLSKPAGESQENTRPPAENKRDFERRQPAQDSDSSGSSDQNQRQRR